MQDLRSAHSTSLTIRTAPSDTADKQPDSPTVWCDPDALLAARSDADHWLSPADLLLQNFRHLVERTRFIQPEPAALSPLRFIRFDDQGTPMFHKSLSEVPAGLTPIRTRSEDFESDLAAHFTAVRGASGALLKSSWIGTRGLAGRIASMQLCHEGA